MTANDKKILYELLKKASDNVYGYASPDFSKEMPNFTDDELPSEKKMDSAEASATAEPVKTTGASIKSVCEKTLSCQRCGLCQNRHNVVPGEGVTHPIVLVVGEGPGADEDASGRPFVGPAGQLLDKMLAAINLDRHTNCFIANIVKCRPQNNRDPHPEEADACRAFLEAQITVLQPKMILAVGRIASQNLLKTETGISRLRNQFFEVQNIPTLCTYHPSALLRNVDLKRPAWEDLKLFKSHLESIYPEYEKYCGTFYTPAR